MKLARRCTLGVFCLALLLSAAPVRAQVLKQLPADPMAVIKINNPQAVSQKLGALAQRLGLANFSPELADPLSAVTKKMKVQGGFDPKGEIAFGIYEPTGGPEPRVVALVPVTDYKAFVGNFAPKDEDKLTVLTIEGESFYFANWGAYAAFTPNKELLAQPPAGFQPAGFGAKQLDSNDATLYVNLALLGKKHGPQLKEMRPMMVQSAEQDLEGNPQFNQKFTPVVMALLNQALNVAEGFLRDGQSATFGINIGKEGISLTGSAEFNPDSYSGNLVKGIKNTNTDLLAGLPNKKYFVYGGLIWDAATASKAMDDFAAPIVKELNTVGDDAKGILSLYNGLKTQFSAIDGATFAFVVPGQLQGQSLIQQVYVYTGDAKKFSSAQAEIMQGTADVMKLLPPGANASFKFDKKEGAKSVAGVNLDEIKVQFKMDDKTPEGQQAAQFMKMLYGGESITTYQGILDDKTVFVAAGLPDDALAAFVTAAKSKEDPLGASEVLKKVAAQLPPNRCLVEYVAVDNIVTTVVQYLKDVMQMPIQLKLQENLPPLGLTIGTEGSAVRGDAYISSELLENIVAAIIQTVMQRAGGPRPGAL